MSKSRKGPGVRIDRIDLSDRRTPAQPEREDRTAGGTPKGPGPRSLAARFGIIGDELKACFERIPPDLAADCCDLAEARERLRVLHAWIDDIRAEVRLDRALGVESVDGWN